MNLRQSPSQQFQIKWTSDISQSILIQQMMKMLMLALVCLLLSTAQSLRVQSHQVKTVTTMAQYDSLVASLKTPYVVEFTADWCGPCRALDPILQKVEIDFNGKWTLIKVDIDQPKLNSLTKTVVTVPILAFYRGPQKVFEKAGLITEGTFRQYVSQHLV